MKATELRLGNYVDLFGKLAYITKSDFSETDYGIAIESGKPIPITEEWLVKLGFKRKEKIVNEDVYIKGSLGIFPDYHIVVYYVDTCKDGSHTIPITLKYVHQLQNLYFALTGEELELNTETK